MSESMTPNPVEAPDDVTVEEALHGYILAFRPGSVTRPVLTADAVQSA